jgi:hypothetical protein
MPETGGLEEYAKGLSAGVQTHMRREAALCATQGRYTRNLMPPVNMEDIHRLTEFERQYLLQDRRNRLVYDGVAVVDVALGKRANKWVQFWARPGRLKSVHGGPPSNVNRIPGMGAD